SRPVRELKGFHRIALRPGEARRIGFDLSTDRLAIYDPERGWIVEPGSVEVMLGASSADIRLRDEVELIGAVRGTGSFRELLTPVCVDSAPEKSL
ncbi:MAG: fibronectin type III-like domain-contianing protein, partial [Myxococcota bacterium]